MAAPQSSLGILMLDEGLPAGSPQTSTRDGALLNPKTLGFPIITEVVKGAWTADVIRGEPSLEGGFVAAARRLEARGAAVITADCGFTIRHQSAIAEAVDVPVVTSSLVLVPTLLRLLPESAQLAIVTADSRHCRPELFGLADPADGARVVVGGVEHTQLMQNWLKLPVQSTPIAEVEAEVGACVAQLRSSFPLIGGLLFECTGFPVVTTKIREAVGLPTWDIATACRLVLESVGLP